MKQDEPGGEAPERGPTPLEAFPEDRDLPSVQRRGDRVRVSYLNSANQVVLSVRVR